ncbi:unnamed protein product [Danaus chrysippus]|uniref:(African queen) hypothetical protein n=1 Tax=Danaus chrysippus TaxID=151541 RepID=A0A8J2VWB9_9NEOP|nr:unnamed protein product [Danaus chrysippus]
MGADPGSPAGAVAGAPAGADTGVPAGADTGVPAGARAAAPAAAGVDGFLVGGGAFNDLAAFLLPDFVMTVSNPSLSSSASEEDGVESDSASEPIGEQSMSHGLLFGQSGEAGLSVSNEVGFTSGFTSVNSLYASGGAPTSLTTNDCVKYLMRVAGQRRLNDGDCYPFPDASIDAGHVDLLASSVTCCHLSQTPSEH